MEQVKRIPLTQGKYALVDEVDFAWLSEYRWQALRDRKLWYAVRRHGYSHVRMHREIMGLSDPKVQVDHIDHDGLNNQRSNLRIATPSQNIANSRKSVTNATGYIGVQYSDRHKTTPYRAYCQHQFLGMYATAQEAALAYDQRAREVFGEFARTNF